MTISVIPELTNSSTMNWMDGTLTRGIISFGMVFVTGRNLVP